jgi:hypothetical protein
MARRDGSNPFVNDRNHLVLDGAEVSGADEMRAIVALANEALRRLGEPCFTREMVNLLRDTAVEFTDADEMPHAELCGAANLIESILPPESA